MKNFNETVNDIKSIKIQGATNIAKAGLRAATFKTKSLDELSQAIHTLKNARPTEPLLQNSLNILYEKVKDAKKLKSAVSSESKKIVKQIEEAHGKTVRNASKLIKKNFVIFTHCHSSTVTGAILASKSKGIEVINTETRPRYQGRLTAKELSGAGIPTTMIVDSAMADFLPNADIILVGTDAISEEFFVNKVGTFGLSLFAKMYNIPLYVLTNSMKFAEEIEIEYRNSKEIWSKAPKNLSIINPAFDVTPLELVKGIVSEHGVHTPKQFVKMAKKEYGYLFKF
ncbi:MAG TPA: hypothetical protein ENN30_01260 [Candidatus Woesearchaeota archaeon]|nr:hypothetical protein [Candidatus Woesearchaeota archaeon]